MVEKIIHNNEDSNFIIFKITIKDNTPRVISKEYKTYKLTLLQDNYPNNKTVLL